VAVRPTYLTYVTYLTYPTYLSHPALPRFALPSQAPAASPSWPRA